MHELPILQSIVGVVLQHAEEAGATRVLAVDLEVGELRDLDEECMQRYFDYVSAGTPAADATLRVRRSPVAFSCRSCGSTFAADLGSGERPGVHHVLINRHRAHGRQRAAHREHRRDLGA